MTQFIKSLIGITLLTVCTISSTSSAQTSDKIVLYTDRPAARFQAAINKFYSETGVKVDVLEKPYPELLAQLNTEALNTPADLVMTKDLVYLSELAQMGWLKSYNSNYIDNKIINVMKHPQNLWVPISFRTRTIVYNKNTVNPSELSTYEDLANPKWAGRLCLRTSNHGYNEALVADLVLRHGYDQTKNILSGWMQNLAMPPLKGDTALLEQMASGTCDVGISNHYYLAQLVAQKPNFPVQIFYANQNKGGVHTNGTGVGIVKTSTNEALATKFMEILLDDQINLDITAAHFEFSPIQNLTPTTLIKDWGPFFISPLNWSEIGKQVPSARQLFKEVGYL